MATNKNDLEFSIALPVCKSELILPKLVDAIPLVMKNETLDG